MSASLHRAGVTLRLLFSALATVGALVAVSALLFWPSQATRAPPKASSQPVRLRALPLWRQLQSCEFLFVACFIVTHILRQGFMLTTIGRRAEVVFGDKLGNSLVDLFSIALPLGFLPMGVFTACRLADRLAAKPERAFVIVSALSMVWGVLLVVWWAPAYILAFALYPLTRQLVFSTFFTYCGATFGYPVVIINWVHDLGPPGPSTVICCKLARVTSSLDQLQQHRLYTGYEVQRMSLNEFSLLSAPTGVHKVHSPALHACHGVSRKGESSQEKQLVPLLIRSLLSWSRLTVSCVCFSKASGRESVQRIYFWYCLSATVANTWILANQQVRVCCYIRLIEGICGMVFPICAE